MGIQAETVQLGHGSGGQMMKRIIDEVFLEAFGSPELLAGNDAGVAELSPSAAIGASPSTREPATHDDTTAQARLAMSTDSFVVTPQFFPGGDKCDPHGNENKPALLRVMESHHELPVINIYRDPPEHQTAKPLCLRHKT